MKEQFNIEHQYQLYLKRIGLSEATMHGEQKKQLRLTFYGACGQMLILLREDLAAIENEDEAAEVLQNMLDQVGNFLLNKSGQQN